MACTFPRSGLQSLLSVARTNIRSNLAKQADSVLSLQGLPTLARSVEKEAGLPLRSGLRCCTAIYGKQTRRRREGTKQAPSFASPSKAKAMECPALQAQDRSQPVSRSGQRFP